MANPRHKIFFGFPTPQGGNTTGKTGTPGGGADPYTWDSEVIRFDSQTITFDMDDTAENLTAQSLANLVTWDMETIPMDTETINFD